MRLLAAVAWLLLAAAPAPPTTFAPWNAGLDGEPAFQVQSIDADTFVIRQSIRTNFEAPFLYLLFGHDRALLLDSGAGGTPIRPTIDAIIDAWTARNGGRRIPLVVAHSHGHGDHHQGDAEFAARPDTTVIGLAPQAVAAFFNIQDWPRTIGMIELGRRRLEIIPTPGHERAHIMVLDPRTHLLLTGDSLYPGRLYVPIDRFSEYRDSIDRAVAATRNQRAKLLLGAHIEMRRTTGEDYVQGAPKHPDEHPLELPYASLLELQAALHAQAGEPVRETRADFIIVPRPPS